MSDFSPSNQVPGELWVVIDPSDRDSVFSALYEEACHEHINEAIAEDIDGAEQWIVRKYVLASGSRVRGLADLRKDGRIAR